jgi:hypothetical protein
MPVLQPRRSLDQQAASQLILRHGKRAGGPRNPIDHHDLFGRRHIDDHFTGATKVVDGSRVVLNTQNAAPTDEDRRCYLCVAMAGFGALPTDVIRPS